jgi:eukaryotic-like serine/threonine-protein kinase
MTALAPGYEVLAHLSRGRALDVYEVWSEERDCRCVAKVVRPDRLRDRGPRRRLRNEGRLLLSLTHPHLVRAYELIERPHPVLVLETLEGETVAHMVASRRRRLPTPELAVLGLHLCSALRYLHRRGWLHLDLKPSNVIVDAGLAKLIDLSIVRRPGRSRGGVGTRRYMAPEQRNGGVLTEAADVWGLGAVLYEVATGGTDFERPVSAHRRLPRRLGQALDACLEHDPAARPSLLELAGVLDSVAPAQTSSE